MTEPPKKTASAAQKPGSFADRRTNIALRRLIDEMLGRVRELNAESEWTPEEREQAERELESILASIKREASHGGDRGESGDRGQSGPRGTS